MDIADFPRHSTGAVSGMQPKLLARKIGEFYVCGLTESELQERYQSCANLVEQLSAYCQRKLIENPGWSQDKIIDLTNEAMRKKVLACDWDFTSEEQDWIISKLKLRFSEPIKSMES